MSWQGMVDENLVGTGQVSKAAICGQDGSVWAKSGNFNPSADELSTASRAFADPGTALASGLRFEGQKYFVLQADDERVIGKQGPAGFVIYKTNQAFILSLYGGEISPGNCSLATSKLADYLKSTGY